ncbi:hypothetical protein MACH26_22390 [Planctobacterium marinum]|uniref:histidine kinase n=2 Tax=Planctobacterium marinum TaxID=1631968 RepID=A0AA48HVP2_9ALTE|nr:hypothetical protein MACH26_22390 [Planctobacterium marinum]
MGSVHLNTFAMSRNTFPAIESIDENNLYTTSLYEDKGAIWVGSLNGLAMIRPGEKKIYNTTSGHLSGDHITGITSDINGTIWASIYGGGIFYINEREKKHGLIQSADNYKITNCYDISESNSQKKIFFSCDSNLFVLDVTLSKISRIKIPFSNVVKIRDIVELSVDVLCIGTWGHGVFIYDLNSNQLSTIPSLKDSNINDIVKTSLGGVLISTTDGAFIYKNDKELVKISNKIGGKLWDEDVETALEMPNGTIFLSFLTHGLYEFDQIRGGLSRPSHLSPLLELKSTGTVSAMSLINESNSLVIGTGENGVFLFPFYSSFVSFFQGADLFDFNVSYLDMADEKILLGDGIGLSVLNQQSNTFESLSKNIGFVYFVLPVEKGFLVSTNENGFLKINMFGDVVETNYKIKGLESHEGISISEVLKLSDNRYLLGADFGANKGLFYGGFDQGFSEIEKELIIIEILKVADNKALILTAFNGVLLFDWHNEKIIHFPRDNKNSYTDCIEQLNEHQFLICVRRNKAQIFDLRTKSFTDFEPGTTEIRNVRTAELDAYDNLWLASSRGLYVYNMKSEELTKVTEAEGVFSTEFSSDMSLLLDDGTLILPGNKGVIAIDTAKANAYFQEKRRSITKSLITRVHYILADQSEHRPVLPQLADNNLVLPYDNIVLRIQLSHNNLLEAGQLRYETRLLGLSEEWEMLEVDKHSASFTTMQPGEYEFQARVADPRSLAEQPVVSLGVTVLPPWWKTAWAYLTYSLLLLGLIYFISWYRNKRLLEINEQLTLKVAERTETISHLLKQKQAFFANVSHEFRTPLTLISGPLDVIAQKLDSPQEHKLLQIVKRNTSRLMRLVDQILELAKLETNRSLPKQVYDLRDTIQVITASFAALLERNHQTLTISQVPKIKINVIEDSFEMIVTNLLSNAIKYSGENTEISLDIKIVEQQLEIEIKDSGKGISKENQAIMFERFTRFDAEENIEGSGIGLALVKQLVSSNGGSISVESELGFGTAFKIVFPSDVITNSEITQITQLKELGSEIDAVSSLPKLTSSTESNNVTKQVHITDKYKILVVDDNADLREFISDSLSADYEIETAVNGKDGFEKAMHNIPDLILSDIIMPEMDGYDFANAIRNDHATSHIPLVLLTAKGDDLSRMKGWEENVDDYLTKPFNLKELRIRIQRLLSIRDILRKKHTADLSNKLATKNQEAISFQTKRDKEFFKRFEKVIGEHYQKSTSPAQKRPVT